MKLICPICDGDDLAQEVTFLIDPNARKNVYEIYPAELTFQDFFWCNSCDQEINPKEIK